jgi:phosphatidylinositol-3-phosphatase
MTRTPQSLRFPDHRPPGYRRLGWALAAFVAAALIFPELAQGTGQPGLVGAATPAAIGQRPPEAASHVVLVVEENHEFSQVIGSPRAPFLNRLAARGTLLSRYYAVTHPSLPNYLALVAGSPLGIRRDCGACHRTGRTLVDQLQAAGISWKAYYQSLPAPCSAAARAGAYTKAINPFLHLDGVRANPLRCRQVVPLTQLGTDLELGQLPRFVMVTPDLMHDMHSGSIGRADTFLRRLDHQLLAAPARRGGILLIVTFDEGRTRKGLGGHRGGGHIATVVAGPGVPPGRRDPTPYDHYALLRSLEQRFGVPPLRHAADPGTKTIPAIAGPPRAA